MKVIKQNILEVLGPAVICHQVNCMGIMGGGLAYQIAQKWPEIEQLYKLKTDWQLGDCQIVRVRGTEDQFVANMAGQNTVSSQKCETDYPALVRSLRVARDFADANALVLYVPHGLGCGLAGGDWFIVEKLIEYIAPDAVICFYEV